VIRDINILTCEELSGEKTQPSPGGAEWFLRQKAAPQGRGM